MANPVFHQTVISKMPIETQKFTWKINHFAKIRSSKEAVELQKFHFDMGSTISLPTKWKCYLNHDGKDWIGASFRLDELSAGNASKVLATFALKIDNANYFKGLPVMQDMLKFNISGWNKVIPVTSTGPENQKALPLDADGSLTIDIEVNLFNFDAVRTPEVDIPLATLMSKFEPKFVQKLQQDLTNMFKNPFPQSPVPIPILVRIISNDNKEFLVNRGILAARSPVFRSMFESSMLETHEGVVKVDDISGDPLEVVLHYIHTGALLDNWKNSGIVEELTYASDKYLLEDLLKFLDQALGLICTAQNCGELLSLARKVKMNTAEEDLTKYCKARLIDASLQEMIEFFRMVELDDW